VSSKGKKTRKTKQNNNNKKNTTKCPKFKCNTVSISFQHAGVVQLLSHQRKGEKKESGDSSVNGYLRLQLTCPLLSACCCWRLYLCRSQE
jgi:hypothetical protein